jgi:hypothetical protein
MDKWTYQIDQTTKKLIATFSDLNSEQLNWKPDPGTWSIAQNIAHFLLNKSYFQSFEKIKLRTNNIALATRLRHWLRLSEIRLYLIPTPIE